MIYTSDLAWTAKLKNMIGCRSLHGSQGWKRQKLTTNFWCIEQRLSAKAKQGWPGQTQIISCAFCTFPNPSCFVLHRNSLMACQPACSEASLGTFHTFLVKCKLCLQVTTVIYNLLLSLCFQLMMFINMAELSAVIFCFNCFEPRTWQLHMSFVWC